MVYFRRVMTGIDTRPLLAQVLAQPGLWNSDALWLENKRKSGSILYAGENIVLRYTQAETWDRPPLATLVAAKPIVLALMRIMSAGNLGNIVVSRLQPGDEIRRHVDAVPIGHRPFWQRFQIPIISDPGVMFCCGDEQINMTPGEAWWFNNQAPHSVKNESTSVRISLFCDLGPPHREAGHSVFTPPALHISTRSENRR